MRSQKPDVDQGNRRFYNGCSRSKPFKQKLLLKTNGADPKCRFCEKFEETVDRLVSGCPIITPN